MFDSIYSSPVTPSQFFLMTAVALVTGFLYSWIMSFRVRRRHRRRVQPDPLPLGSGQCG